MGLEGGLTVARMSLPTPLARTRRYLLFDDDEFDAPPKVRRTSKPLVGEVLPDDTPDDEFGLPVHDEITQDIDAWRGMTPAELRQKGADGLTPKQRAFVRHYLDTQGNGSEAARQCGFEGASAAVASSRWLRTPSVIAALREAIGQQYVVVAPQMQAQMLKLALHSKSDFVKQQAAKDLLDRANIQPAEPRGPSVRIAIDLG